MRSPYAVASAVCALSLALAGCSGASSGALAPALVRSSGQSELEAPSSATIAHVIVIVQENRSVDNLFHGFPGADTANVGYGHDGKRYPLRPVSLAYRGDIDHGHYQFLLQYDRGKNDGFDEAVTGFSKGKGCAYPNVLNVPSCFQLSPVPDFAYSYVPRSEIGPYWTMASRYAFSDRTFASNNGPSYPSHQYLIAGQAGHVSETPQQTPQDINSDGPWGCDATALEQFTILLKYAAHPSVYSAKTGIDVPGPFTCFSYRTAADLLDAAHVTWAYYAPVIGQNRGDIWSAFDAIWPVRFGTDWLTNVKSPETNVLLDIQNGNLPQVSWVVPSFVNSDHAGSLSLTGPQWVASIVNAVGESAYWKNTAIVVVWDDWGGWYDHVVPPQYADPQTGAYEGLGFRVPLIVVSPYARHGYVSHKQHEIASTLHFIETTFGLPSLGLADARADALGDMFDFSQQPAPFSPIPVTIRPADFLAQPASSTPPDDE